MTGIARQPRSARESALLDLARKYLPGGVRNATTSPEYAMVIKEGRGARIWDVSGNAYIDYLLGSGPLLLGHAHPSVVAAVRDHLERGSTYLMVNEPAILLAEAIVQAVPCAEKVCFHSTGSEATLFAMRLARAYRKRDTILKFEGAFHGMSDYALMSNQWTRAPKEYPAPVPNSVGIPRSVAGTVCIAPFNDINTTTAIIEKYHDDLAGIIVEPMQRTISPLPGFLAALRQAATHYDIPLIFDEVVTGFRLAYGGAQEYYGVVPDLCALGKTLSSGHPLSVLCGREYLMSAVDPARQLSGDYVALTGTYSGNPLSCVAALATLNELRAAGVYDKLFATGRQLKDSLQRLLDEAGIPASVTGEPPAFEVWFTEHEITDFRSTLSSDAAMHARLTELLLERGIVKAHEKFFVSLAHTSEDVECTVEAFGSAIDEMARNRGAL